MNTTLGAFVKASRSESDLIYLMLCFLSLALLEALTKASKLEVTKGQNRPKDNADTEPLKV
jgi:hypothetical protein